jgi:hypothetical protein
LNALFDECSLSAIYKARRGLDVRSINSSCLSSVSKSSSGYALQIQQQLHWSEVCGMPMGRIGYLPRFVLTSAAANCTVPSWVLAGTLLQP